jgi:hypothetical protein
MLEDVSEVSNLRACVLTVGPVFVFHVQFAKAEIAQSNVTSIIEEDVLGLQVSVNNIETMQALQGAQKFCCVKSSTINVETLFLLQVVEELSAVHECENKVQLLRRLEGEFEWHDERVVDLGKNRTLCQGVGNFGAGDDVGLANGLEGIDPVGILFPASRQHVKSLVHGRRIHDLHDLAEAAFTDDLEQVEVLDRKLVLQGFHKIHTNFHGAGTIL